MFTITAEELNKLVYPKSCEGCELKHTEKYKKLRDGSLCPEIECFKVKTCGKTHIRMFRKRRIRPHMVGGRLFPPTFFTIGKIF